LACGTGAYPRNHSQKGGFTAPGRPNQNGKCTIPYREVQILYDLLVAKGFSYISEFDGSHPDYPRY
jgi:hypothetical protein